MIKIVDEICLRDFESWGQATENKNIIIDQNKDDMFDRYIAELYPDGLSLCQLNDLLAYDWKEIFKDLDIIEIENDEIITILKNEYMGELKSAYKEDNTIEYILDDLIEKNYHLNDSVRDSQKDDIIFELDEFLESLGITEDEEDEEDEENEG